MTTETTPETEENKSSEAITETEEAKETGSETESSKGEGKGIPFDPETRIAEFKVLVDAVTSKEEICAVMRINELKFYKLLYALSIKENRVIQVHSDTKRRNIKVKSNGITLSLGRIASLGLKDVFKKDTPIKTICKDDTIIIKRADAQ